MFQLPGIDHLGKYGFIFMIPVANLFTGLKCWKILSVRELQSNKIETTGSQGLSGTWDNKVQEIPDILPYVLWKGAQER